MKMLLLSTVLFNAYSCLPPPVVDPPTMDASMAVDMVVADAGTGGIGAPCATAGDCLAGLTCNGRWCTKSCIYHSECSPAARPSECDVDPSGNSASCHTKCTSAADCADYAGSSCVFGTAPAGQFATQTCN